MPTETETVSRYRPPFEERMHMRVCRRWALNRGDLLLGVLSLALITTMVWILLFSTTGQKYLPKDADIRKGITLAVGAGWITISLACIGGAVKVTSARQGLISLLSSEIKAIQYGLTQMNMFGFWKEVHANPAKGAMGFADAPREENYFELFHSVSNNIGELHPRVVEAIVRFYTYLKMSRDAAASLKTWDQQADPTVRQLHISHVVNLLGLSMLWGFVALWSMGSQATEQERHLRAALKDAYEATAGKGQFKQLWERHIRYNVLESFFENRISKT